MPDCISPIDNDSLSTLCNELLKNNRISPEDYRRFDVKRGLRNADGTGVMTGLTRICSVEGYYIDDGERVPKEGRLVYRGIDMSEIVKNCQAENRFGFPHGRFWRCIPSTKIPMIPRRKTFCGSLYS